MMLTILYDDACPFCVRCRQVFAARETLVALRFVSLRSPLARSLVGGEVPRHGLELVVVADNGAYWIGSDAFVMCLWALDETRSLSLMMAHPWVRPWATKFFRALSSRRDVLSRWIGGERCGPGHCGVPPAPHAYR